MLSTHALLGLCSCKCFQESHYHLELNLTEQKLKTSLVEGVLPHPALTRSLHGIRELVHFLKSFNMNHFGNITKAIGVNYLSPVSLLGSCFHWNFSF